MASETMTVAEARIWVVRNPSGEVQGVSTQDEYRAARDAGWGSHGFAAWDADGSMYSGWTITQEAHARATTAGTGAGGERVTEAMVEAARAAFSREWYEDVEARPMRVALTAALAASARGA